MANALRSLWPENTITRSVLSPVAILRRQAEELSSLTDEILVGEVVASARAKDNISLSLEIVAPILSNYRKRILTVYYAVPDQYYPVVFDNPPDTMDFIMEPVAQTQQEFEQMLKSVLGSSEVISVIQSLIARSNDILDRDPILVEEDVNNKLID